LAKERIRDAGTEFFTLFILQRSTYDTG